jgi:adenosine deaminase
LNFTATFKEALLMLKNSTLSMMTRQDHRTVKDSNMSERDLQALPKAHLHIHLEGAMRPSTQGPASVAGAIDQLGAHRILHGVLAVHDPWLVERLARERICLDVCPSSNLMLNVFPSVQSHPLPALLKAGVSCDLGSDDPLLFGPNLLDEFVLCREEMGLSDEQLARMARTSFEYSGAPPAVKSAGVAGVEAWLTAPD